MSKTEKFLNFVDFVKTNGSFCTKEMASFLGVSLKSVQRYKSDFEKIFGVTFESYQKGCYYLKDTLLHKIDYAFDRDAALFFDFLAMVHPKIFELFGLDRQIIQKILKEKEEIYHLKEFPFEELSRSDILCDLKKAIKYSQYIDLVYEPYESFEYKEVKPIKIVYAEGNWYLAAITQDEINQGFKFLRINFIRKIRLLPKQFKKDAKALYFIKNFQTLFSAYGEAPYEVRVVVDKEVARFFRVKKFLSSQKIVEDRGDLIVSYEITNDEEILFLAKRWLPHMRIIEPLTLQKKLEEMVKEFLSKGF